MAASILTPVTILTGFLGSGKTTLLNQLLEDPSLNDTAIIINEFGQVSIDHLLVRHASEKIAVLANGCVCCSVAGELVQALRDLYFKRANGEIPAFKRVVIETTGLADPAPIMHTLIEMPLVVARYALSGVITTVDTTHALTQLAAHREAVKQVAVADRIVLTKCDLAGEAEINTVIAKLNALNPSAALLRAPPEPATLFDTGLYQANAKTPDVKRWLGEAAFRPIGSATAHSDGIRTFVVCYDAPLVWDALADALATLADTCGDKLLRMKGIVNMAGETKPGAIHAVQHTLYPAATLPAWPDDDRTTRLVFITRDADEAFIRATLDAFVKSTPST